MSHRISKKIYSKSYNNYQKVSTQSKNQQTPNFHQQNHHFIRPIIQKTDIIYQHDKYSYKKNFKPFPPPQSLFISQNNYDAGPNFIRTTSPVINSTPKKSNFPYAAWITPLGCDKVHKVKVTSPLRCSRCKSYINPHFRFDGTKKSVICNICGIRFNVEQSVDNQNIINSQIQTEGVIDFVVKDKIYLRKRIDIIKIILVIQTGLYLYQSGILQKIIQSIKSAIQNNKFGSKIKIGIIFFNNDGLKFIKLRNRKGQWMQKKPIIYHVKYNKVGFCCPLSDQEMLFDPNYEKQKLLYLLDIVVEENQKYINQKYGYSSVNYTFTIKCLMESFVNETGRIILFCYNDPRNGILAIRQRKEQENKNMLKPISQQYYKLGKQLVKKRIGIDMFIFSKDSLINHQLATTHYISSLTGGNIYYYPFYCHKNDNLYYTIYSSFSKNYIYDVDFTVRVSNGLNVCGYGVGEGFRQSRDISLSMMDPSSSLSVNFQHQKKIEEDYAFIQYAMMYTTSEGERRIRIINYRYTIVNNIQQLYESVDYLSFANILCRQYVNKLNKDNTQKVRQQFIYRLKLILSESRNQKNINQNIAPALAYIHNIINSKLMLNYLKSTPDIRTVEILLINKLNFGLFANQFYPKLYPINMDIYEGNLIPGNYIQQSQQQQIAIIPTNLALLKQNFKNNGLFIYCSSSQIIILVENDTSCQQLYELFGSDNWQQIQQNGFIQLQNWHNMRVNIIINELRRRNIEFNGIYLPVIIRTPNKKGPYNEVIRNICKQSFQTLTYSNFLDILHEK